MTKPYKKDPLKKDRQILAKAEGKNGFPTIDKQFVVMLENAVTEYRHAIVEMVSFFRKGQQKSGLSPSKQLMTFTVEPKILKYRASYDNQLDKPFWEWARKIKFIERKISDNKKLLASFLKIDAARSFQFNTTLAADAQELTLQWRLVQAIMKFRGVYPRPAPHGRRGGLRIYKDADKLLIIAIQKISSTLRPLRKDRPFIFEKAENDLLKSDQQISEKLIDWVIQNRFPKSERQIKALLKSHPLKLTESN
jgi:hypothetical protein